MRFLALKALLACLVALVTSGFAREASAAIIVEPDSDSSGVVLAKDGKVVVMEFTGFVYTGGSAGNISVSADADSSLDATLTSYSGSFELKLDGETLTPTSTSQGFAGVYFASYDEVALSAGDHTLTIVHTSSGYGAANYHISISANDPSAVPEPATLVLVGTGLVGLFGMRRRKRAAAAEQQESAN